MEDENEVTTAAEEQTENTETTSEEVTEGDTGEDQGDTGEGTSETSSDDDSSDDGKGGKKKLTPYESQKIRAEKAEAEAKKLREKYEPTGKQPAEATAPSDEVVRARLEARGVLDEDEQDVVIEAGKLFKISPFEAMKRPLVQKQLEEMRTEKKAKDATPAPGSGGGRPPTTTNIGLLADKAAKTGELPKNPALAEKVQDELSRRAQAGH